MAVSGSRVEHPRAVREEVTLMRAPDGGIQPQVAVDQKGFLHLPQGRITGPRLQTTRACSTLAWLLELA
jgi:hypothetical protein